MLAPELQFAGLSHTTQLSRDLRLTLYSKCGTVVSLIVGALVGPVVGSVLALLALLASLNDADLCLRAEVRLLI